MASKGPKAGNPGKLPPAAVSTPEAPHPVTLNTLKAEPAENEPKLGASKTVATKAAAPNPVAAKPVVKAKPPLAAPLPKPAKTAAEVLPAPEPIKELPIATTPAAEEPIIAAPSAPIEAPQTTVPQVTDILQKEKTIMEATINTATDKTQAMFGEVNDRAKAAMEKGAKMFEEMNAFGKGNLEAVVESGKIAAKGFETLGQDAAEYTRKQFEGATAVAKSFASVKSPTELFKLQSDYLRSSFDSLVAESSKTTEAMLKLVGEVAQPLSNRVALAAEKVKLAA